MSQHGGFFVLDRQQQRQRRNGRRQPLPSALAVGDKSIRRGFCLILIWSCCTIWWMEHQSNDIRLRNFIQRHLFSRSLRSGNIPSSKQPQNRKESYDLHHHQQHDESWIRLQELGVNVSALPAETRRRIPSWSTIQSQYYDTHSSSPPSQPIIVGLSDCAAYRARVPLLDRVVAPAGLFHSGTNLLVQLLQANCPHMSSNPNNESSHYGSIRGHVQGLAWQVSWGKHNPAWARDQGYHIDHEIYRNIPVDVQLPVVLIRHPYDWMERMCTWSYSVYFPKTTRPNQPHSQCPWLIYDEGDDQGEQQQQGWVPVLAKWGVGDRVYQSLAHLWNEWYQAYFFQPLRNMATPITKNSAATTTTNASSYPRLMVRLEDLIFMPEQVISQICHCVGGVYLPDQKQQRRSFLSVLSSAKSKDTGHDYATTTTTTTSTNHTMMGLVEAWIQYGQLRNYPNLTHDRHLIQSVLDPQVIETFHYQL